MNHLLAALLTALASCASVMTKGTSHISVSTVPAGAHFVTNIAGIAGVTPTIVSLPNGQMVQFTFSLEGHPPLSVQSKPTRSAWVAGNLLFGIVGGVIGFVVDFNTDSTLIHKKDNNAVFPPLDENGNVIEPPAPVPAPRPKKNYNQGPAA